MAQYPNAIYTPREKENRAGVEYDPSKKTIAFAEDNINLDEEVVAIETELGTNFAAALAAALLKRIEGDGAKAVFRSVYFRFIPGSIPNTNLNAIAYVGAIYGSYNPPAITDAVNLAKGGTSGSWSLNATGDVLTLTLAQAMNGFVAISIVNGKWNSAEAVPYFIRALPSGNNINFYIYRVGSVTPLDWTSILDAGDDIRFMLSFLTST